MKYIFSLIAIFIFSSSLFAQDYGLTSVGYLDVCEAHSTSASDIWGFTDKEGNEYAIVGLNNGTSIVKICDPENPEEVFFEPGTNSVWRDIKTWDNHAYVTTEATEGLLIIDLSTLPGDTNLSTTYYNPSGTINGDDMSAHNLFIDENGICYLFGANRGNKGVIMLDLTNDPKAPVEVGEIDNWYAHDGVAKNNTLYLGNVLDGHFSIWNVADKASPVLLGTQITPNSFSHNVWFSDDQNYLYNTDEKSGAFLTEYDISDPTDITETDRIRTTTTDDVIPHNTHFLNDFIITSYYRDGVIIHDVSEKGNMVEVARYDTSPAFSGNGFNGCWGVYPYLPSGLIIASDIENGLHILKTDLSIGITGAVTSICKEDSGTDGGSEEEEGPEPVSVDENFSNALSISPNPFNDKITIKGDVSIVVEVKLFNVLGELVYTSKAASNEINIPLSLNKGIYFVTISNGSKMLLQQKMVKE